MTAETQRPIARYKIGYHTDDWGMRSSTPSGIPDHAGAWVRYEDHIAALVEAQQPAPSAAAVGKALNDHQIAFLVNDLSDIAVKFHATQQLRERISQVVSDALAAGYGIMQQVGPRHPTVVRWRNNGIEACAGIADAYGCADAAHDMRAMLTSPTPQADSQPALVADGCTDPYNCKRCMTHPNHRGGMEHAGIPAHAVARAASAPADSGAAPAGVGEPVALLVRKNSWREGQWEAAPPNSPTYGLAWANQRVYVYTTPQPTQAQAGAVPLTDREIELIDGMIQIQLDHASRCDAIPNRPMADKQKGWDMERVALLQKLKAHGIKGGQP